MASENMSSANLGAQTEGGGAGKGKGRRLPRPPRPPTRMDRLETGLENLTGLVTEFVNTFHGVQPARAQPSNGQQATPKNSRSVRSGRSRRGEEERTRTSVFDRLAHPEESDEEVDSTWTPSGSEELSTTDLRDRLNARRNISHGVPQPRNPRNGRVPSARNEKGGRANPPRGARIIQPNQSRTSGAYHEQAKSQSNRSIREVQLEQQLERMQRRMDDYEANRKVPEGIKDMMDETEPPFTKDILIEEFPADFKMIPIKQYDGKENPAGHMHGYCTWMRIRGATQAQMCLAFSLTLTGPALQWFQQLEPGSIGSFRELKQQYLGRFVMAKTRKKDKLYLYSLKQGTEESLKSYIKRFSQEMNYVEGYTDSDAVAAIREGLLEGSMLKSIVHKQPKTFAELITRAQKFISAEEYMRNRRGPAQAGTSKLEGKRKVEEGAKGSDQKKQKAEVQSETSKLKALTQKFQAYTPPDVTKIYTPLNTTREQILMQIQHRNLLVPPAPMKGDPNKRDRSKYCRFHQDFGHDTSNCYQLKGQIEALVQQGQLREFVERVIAERRITPPMVQQQQQQPITPAPLAENNNPVGELNDVRTIFGGPETGGAKLTPVLTPLYGFAGECVKAEGVITLPVTMGEDLAQITRMVNFLVVDRPSVYNAIIGRPTLNAMRAVTSTYHLMMKFPTENGIGVVVGSQKEARICYVNATNGESSAKGKEVISTIYQIDGDLPTDLPKDLNDIQNFGELDPREEHVKR
ncbi:hypothetical protein TIFTF001_051655 [Ficus carica]|uniref:Retrotransposon gag domain-containing protein n=1 Tax=Ficus carica TaxID=3494 RepID=A0AA87ZJX8_FICCA|nr:hypothetical protein TIFTF001_051655 [Ficus carica]